MSEQEKVKVTQALFSGDKIPTRGEVTSCYEEYLSIMGDAKKTNGDIIRAKVWKSMQDLPLPTECSEEFCGVYVHGGHSQLILEEHEPAFASFRKFSQKLYPLYFFYGEQPDHQDAPMKELASRYAPVQVINIPVLEGLAAYSKFMIWEALQKLPEKYEKVLTFQSDGFLKSLGWEDWVNHHDPDYVGAPWWSPLNLEAVHFKDPPKWVPETEGNILVGNGGFSFRKRSKMIEIANAITEEDFTWDEENLPAPEGGHTVEDSIICAHGFGKKILKDIDPKIAREFSSEPFNENIGLGFHGFI